MRIFGIDPGLQVCGYGCLDVSQAGEKLIEAGVFRTPNDAAVEIRLNSIAKDIESVLKKLSHDIVAEGNMYANYDNSTTSLLM